MSNKDKLVLQELRYQITQSESQLKKVNEEYDKISREHNKLPYQTVVLFEENADLSLVHKLCEEDINNYKKQLKTLTEKQKQNEEEILKLKQENEKLKKKKNQPANIAKKESKGYKNFIHNLKDLSKNIGFQLKKKGDIPKKEKDQQKEKDEIKDIEKKRKKKEEYEKKFKELKNKSNEFNKNLDEQKKIIDEYKQYLDEVNQFINLFNEKMNISVINSVLVNNNEINKQFDEINKQVEVVSKTLAELDEPIFTIKNAFGQTIENLLIDIQNCFENLEKKENQNETSYNNNLEMINKNIEEIQSIFSDFDKISSLFYNQNHKVQREMNQLKYLYALYAKEYKKKRPVNSSIVNPINNNINQNNNNNRNNQNNNQNNQNNQNNVLRPKKTLGQSFLFTVRDHKSKDDLYKTVNLFKENSEQDMMEMYLDEAQLLRKNYHVMCYVYDDYDLYDIYYDLKAVGLRDGEYFPKGSHGFYYDKKIEVQKFLINDVPSKYTKKAYSIDFDINLKNFEYVKVHIVYKAIKDLSQLSKGEKEERNIYRYERYGLEKSLAGQMAKFSLILKGSFDIVNFEEYFFVRNKKNIQEVEYVWGGCVPVTGKTTLIMLSKKEAKWSYKYSSKFHSNNYIKNSSLYIPIEFIGGNNEILNITPHSPQSTNLLIDEENRQYIIEYRNTNYKSAEFLIEGELLNKCKGEWLVDLTDEQVDSKMNPEDAKNKSQLKAIAEKIIKDFDNENKDSDFEYLDYMKIGMWVYKNIKYDYNCLGKTQYSAMDIYNMRIGVCHHFTRLSNALLYSLGYKVIYASGYCCKKNKSFNTSTGHAWSLVKLGNKWYPFDSTWGIFTGKLPVGHIFGSFFSRASQLEGYDHVSFDQHEMEGKFIG